MPRRQLVRADEVGAPRQQDDQLSQANVRTLADTAVTNEDFFNAIISQLRIAQGGRTWTEQAPPAPVAPYNFVRNERLTGMYDGQSLIYGVEFYFVPQTIEVYLNGQLLAPGMDADYIVHESGGQGAGFDTVEFVDYGPVITMAPRPTDHLLVHYQRSGGPVPHTAITP